MSVPFDCECHTDAVGAVVLCDRHRALGRQAITLIRRARGWPEPQPEPEEQP